MGKPCAVPNCNKNSKILNLKRSLFKVPTDEILRRKWQTAIPNLKSNQFVCDRHFEDSCIVRRFVRHDTNGQLLADTAYKRPHLTPDAVPTILITADGFERSLLQQHVSNNDVPMELDSSQERQEVFGGNETALETAVAVVVTPSQQQQDLHIKIEKASQKKFQAAMDLQQPDASMMSELAGVGINNESKIEKDNVLEGTCEEDVAVVVTSSQQQQDSHIKIEEASPVTLEAVIDLQQPDAPMTRELAVVGISTESKIEKINASVIGGRCEEGVAKTVKVSVGVTNGDESNSEFVQSGLLKVEKSLQALRAISKLQVSSTCNISDENADVKLPTTWSISQRSVKLGTEIILYQIGILMDNDAKTLIVKRYIIIENWSGRMQYYVHGKEVNADAGLLPKVLIDVSTLPVVLAKFERKRVCRGLGSVNSSFIKDEAFKDYSDSWHHKDCTLITKTNKCENCKKLKRTLWQRQHRCAKRATTKNVSGIVDDHTQLKILKRQLRTQRRLKNLAKSRLKVLRYRLQLKQEEIANLTTESIEEKCRKSNVSERQTVLVKEIFAAAKTSNRGQRYSEDWVMQCMLMYTHSPSYYQFLQDNDIIPLPCTRTIRKYYSLIDTKCDFDANSAK